MIETHEDILAHFGVKGMKWGVRKDRKSGSSQRNGGGGSKEKTKRVKIPTHIKTDKTDGAAFRFTRGDATLEDSMATLLIKPAIPNVKDFTMGDVHANIAGPIAITQGKGILFTQKDGTVGGMAGITMSKYESLPENPFVSEGIVATVKHLANKYDTKGVLYHPKGEKTPLTKDDEALYKKYGFEKNGTVKLQSKKGRYKLGEADEYVYRPESMTHVAIRDLSDTLEHFGVKGMKWGVRKDRKSGGSSKKSTSQMSEDYKNFSRNANKKVSELSNRELQEVINRARLQGQWRQMNPTKADKARNFIKSTGKNLGKGLNQFNSTVDSLTKVDSTLNKWGVDTAFLKDPAKAKFSKSTNKLIDSLKDEFGKLNAAKYGAIRDSLESGGDGRVKVADIMNKVLANEKS